ncbi:hypothetical protein CRYUN_Cryun31cG0110000 [Craigia yunnanensis]
MRFYEDLALCAQGSGEAKWWSGEQAGAGIQTKMGIYILINNGTMDMYVKCGSMREAYLSEFKHDDVTFVGVLSACSHAGFVSLGRQILGQMKSKYCVVPTIEHYTCVVDMLCRAGQLEEAYQLALTSPTEANAVVSRALLAACWLHGNSDIAEVAAKHVLRFEPEHSDSYVLMSNVYVAAGKYEELLHVRNMMRQQNVRKLPGCSWIEVKNGVHAFINGDRTHPGSNFYL